MIVCLSLTVTPARLLALSTTTPQTSRDRRRLRTRRELAVAAVRLFEHQGVSDTTVEEIAASADYSASTFFRLFPRKEDAVFFDMPARLHTLRGELAPGARWPQIRAALVAHARSWEADDPEFAAARVRLFHQEPQLAGPYLEYCQQYEDWLTEIFDAAAPKPQARLAAACVISALRIAFRLQADGAKGSVAAAFEDALSTLEHGPLKGLR